jgi:hypothetical protein
MPSHTYKEQIVNRKHGFSPYYFAQADVSHHAIILFPSLYPSPKFSPCILLQLLCMMIDK